MLSNADESASEKLTRLLSTILALEVLPSDNNNNSKMLFIKAELGILFKDRPVKKPL